MFRREPEAIELENKRQRDIRATSIGAASAAAVDLSVLGTIFFLLSKQALTIVFEQTAKYVLLPAAAAANIAQAILAWRKAQLEKYEGSSVRTAIVETIGAALITTAVIGSIAASAAFTIVGPALFVAAFSIKTLYNFGNAIYNGVMAYREQDPEKKVALRAKAIEFTIGGIVGVIATIGVAAVMLAGKTALTIMGIIGGVAGAVLAIKKITEIANQNTTAAARNAQRADNHEDDRDLTTTARLQHGLGINRSASQEALLEHDEHRQTEDERLQAPAQPVATTPANDAEIEKDEPTSPKFGRHG